MRVRLLGHGGDGRHGCERRLQRSRRRLLGRKRAFLRLLADGRRGFADGHGRRRVGEARARPTLARVRRVHLPSLSGESLGDGVVVDGQIGEGVEDVALPDDGVHQIGVAYGEYS